MSNKWLPFKKGDRVYQAIVHAVTGEELRKHGMIASDELPLYDYVSVDFDDDKVASMFPVLIWYLHRESKEIEIIEDDSEQEA